MAEDFTHPKPAALCDQGDMVDIGNEPSAPKLRFPASMWNDPDGDGIVMNEAQVSLMWNQTYAFGFALHNVRVPDEAREALGLKKRSPGVDEFKGDDEAMFPDEEFIKEEVFTRAQKVVLEYHAFAVKRLSEIIPVPESIRQRLIGSNRLSPDSEEPSSGNSMEQDQEIAACNCPYCWLYTEDLTRFMEHLWDEHAKPIEIPQERKDSGFDEDISIEEPDVSVKDEPKRKEYGKPSLESTGNLEPSFLKNLLNELPEPKNATGRIPETDIISASWLGDSRPFRLRSIDSKYVLSVDAPSNAQKVRDNIKPFYWFDPYHLKLSPIIPRDPKALIAETGSTSAELLSTPAAPSEFKKPTIPASKLKSISRSPEKSGSDYLGDYLNDRRYWICAHEEECQSRFDSLVLLIEHLSRHGYVVYKKWSELHKPAPSSKELLASGWSTAGF